MDRPLAPGPYDVTVVGVGALGRGGRATSPHRSGVGLAVLLILGVLGMHALAQHCVPSAGEPAMTGMLSEASSSQSVTTLSVAGAHAMGNETASSALPPSVHDADQPDPSMVALCAVMLLAAGTALVLLLGFRNGWPRGWSLRRAVSSMAGQVVAPLSTGPPYVLAFAVVRC